MKIKFNSYQVRPERVPFEKQDEVVKWTSFNDDGNVVVNKVNFQAKIQSAERMTNYKDRIEQLQALEDGGFYGDVSNIGDNFNDISEYLASLVNSAIAAIPQEKFVGEVRQNSNQDTEIVSEIKEGEGEK